MKVKVNLSLLTYIRHFDKNKSNVKKMKPMDWKILLLGVAIIRNNLYRLIGEEKDDEKINHFLDREMIEDHKIITITKEHREKFLDGRKPSYIFKSLEKLTTSEVVMYHNEDNVKCSNLFLDRELNNNVINFKIGSSFLKEIYLPKKSDLLQNMNIIGDFSIVEDDIFKFKNIASFILYIIFSKQKYVLASIEDWNNLFGVKFSTKDLIKKIEASLLEINTSTSIELNFEKLDTYKKKIDKKTTKICYLKITKTTKYEIEKKEYMEYL